MISFALTVLGSLMVILGAYGICSILVDFYIYFRK